MYFYITGFIYYTVLLLSQICMFCTNADFFFSTAVLNEYRESSVMLKPMAIVTDQTVDEGGRCQQARKHLTLEETGKDSLPLPAISDKAAIRFIAAS